MKKTVLLLAMTCMFATSMAYAQLTGRTDVVWARTVVDGTITLDGVLNEPAWTNAEAVQIQFGVNAGLPGSGWHFEGTPPPTDPTDATLRFLVVGNELYLGVTAKDSSIGGGAFNRFDGILMNIRNKANPARPAPPFEYFYAWWDNDPNTLVKGAMPGYFGAAGGPRTPDNLQIWEAATTVDGVTNSDTTADGSYTMEFRLNLTPRGYDVMRSEGDIISFNISIYDADWQWPVIPGKLSGNRAWFQGPFTDPVFNTVRIYARPDVTVNSGDVPEIGPEVIIPNAANYDAPAIDGQLSEAVWANAPSFDLKYGDDAVRQTYPSIGPIASGQFQPEINGGRAAVVDPGDATFKYFFKDDKLYVGVDVRDQLLISLNTGENQWDGIRFMILDRAALDANNHVLAGHELVVRFDSLGQVIGEGDLATLGASYGVSLKPGSTVNDFNNVDDGYYIELSVDLTQIGYPAGLGDGVAFIGALLFDGDSFPNSADDYGSRVWWFKERGNNASAAWAYMDSNTLVPGGEPGGLTRTDVVWARTVIDGAITLDGVLNEPEWSKAEAVRIQYGVNAGLPGSGWNVEGAAEPTDPTDATLRFLVVGNELYLGISAKDSSVGGGLFNRFDGILMNIRTKTSPGTRGFEYFYGWVTEPWADPNTGLKGALPGYFGPAGGPRNPDNLQIWDAATTVDGVTNSDTTADGGYTMEFRLNLTPRGYDVMRAEGDIISFNMSIYDADWQWPVVPGKLSGNRVWFQGPFTDPVFNTVRIYARPDVTVNSGDVPEIGPEVIIPNAANYDAPAIDGQLSEAVWANAPSFDLKYGDDDVRATYPSIGPIASGQFQPDVNGGKAAVVDPGDATFKYFFKDEKLYVGVDVRDQLLVSLNTGENQWDGIRFMILDRATLDANSHVLSGHELVVRFDSLGQVIGEGDLATLGASYAVSLKPGSTVNDFNNFDDGYFIELAIDLTQIGYPSGLGDGVAFIGALLFDGDSFPNSADDYGTRVWWFKERGNNASPVWAYMDPNTLVTSIDDKPGSGVPVAFALIGNYPNPFNPSTTIRFAMPEDGIVTMKVYDILGRSAATIPLGMKQAGFVEATFDASRLSSGVYFYRLHMVGASTRREFSTLYGKMMLLK